jgi:hypothetical protein
MAKARRPSKKKKAATKSPTKKKAATKKSVKKATPKKKTAKKKAAKKAVKKIAPRKSLRRAASRPPVTIENSGAEPESVEVIPVKPKCKCEEKDGLFFLLVKQKNGKYKESPLHAPFETLAECEAKCMPE